MAEKIAEALAMDDGSPLSAEQVSLRTRISNSSPKTVEIMDSHFWAGRASTIYPRIPTGYYGMPSVIGTLPEGVKWGISYADGEDSTARKWVVAFDTKAQKAYAEAGPIGPIDWNVVEVKLDQHSTNKAEYEDKILGGKCSAEIDDLNAKAVFR